MKDNRFCSRSSCQQIAVATLTYDYKQLKARITKLTEIAEPHGWDLCGKHANSTKVPYNWVLEKELTDFSESLLEEDLDLLPKLLELNTKSKNHLSNGRIGSNKSVSFPKVAKRGHLRVLPSVT